MLAVTPLFAVLGGTLMLELAVPVLSALAPVPGEIDARAAMAFFMIGAVHVALMVLVLKVAGTMVGNWTVFGLVGESGREAQDAPSGAAEARAAVAASHAQQASGSAAPAPSRRIAISGVAAGIPANDGSAGGVAHRETRIIGSAAAGQAQSTNSTLSRARGIGSRFRAAPARQTEKFK